MSLADAPPDALKRAPLRVIEVPDAEPVLDTNMLQLCQWIAEYYVVPLGMTIRSALPVLLSGARQPAPPRRTERRIRVVTRPSLMEREKIFGRAARQRSVFEFVEALGGETTVAHLRSQMNVTSVMIHGLVKRGLIEVAEEEVERDPFATRRLLAATGHNPTAPQLDAIHSLEGAKPGEVFLLRGVTGSGKTLVYIELLKKVVLERGRTAIVLVPEIALTPQTVDRFRAEFGDDIAVLHSALSDGERYDAWLALKRGDKRIAVGARSAIFAPLANLGALIVDEEHEASYKQGESPRYHAREVAMMRARIEGAVTVLGSATPSLESWTNALSGKYSLLTLGDRVGGGALPEVGVIDLKVGKAVSPHASGDRGYASVIRPELDAALAERLSRGEQSILLLNRRGYASFMQCAECGAVETCPNCSITLTHHRSPDQMVCHYCLHKEPTPVSCRQCGGKTLRQRGLGTQQVERLITERFPGARVARMDIDTTSGKWAHARILDSVGAGEVDILLGTQMIAKGLDFPNVTLVGVVDADVGINLPDFRASERAFQLLSQVAGRAGRGSKGGKVLIQTRVPKHHAVTFAVRHDFESFAREELKGRVQPPYPPNVRLANIVVSGVSESATADLAIAAGDWLKELLSRKTSDDVAVIGPAPCPVERIKNRWRWHLLMKSGQSGELARVGRYFLERFDVPAMHQLRVTLDRDPVSVL